MNTVSISTPSSVREADELLAQPPRKLLTDVRAKLYPAAARLTEADVQAFLQGTELRAADKLGAHLKTINGTCGVEFAVWAPNAQQVTVMGSFNDWNKNSHPLHPLGHTGIWTDFIADVKPGTHYKFYVVSRHRDYSADKADPFAFAAEIPPRTASVVSHLDYEWGDRFWMRERRWRNAADAPMSIYEVHLGSWRRVPEENHRSLTYRELAPLLAEYVRDMGFTHVELLPITEHPFYGSWGYQPTGFFAPTSRFGTPEDFMYFVDRLHRSDIGVILDWVPSHFPTDMHGLAYFDGTHLFEHADPRKGFHPDWKSAIFNHGRNEVRSFLLSSALFWLEKYHLDGLRLDAVASMLYLDYSRRPGEWIPNHHGGRENLDAIHFLQRLNTEVYAHFPDVVTIAEDSTAWPKVSHPVHAGGLGFGMKWDMGWMHDTLRYFSRDPIHRKFHQNDLTFRMLYAFKENYVLPLSHDEVVHGKGSLFGRMTGDEWQKYANLRLLYGYMFAQPGKKLIFMGGELAQWPEWNHESSVEWHALDDRLHAGVQKWIADLNHLYTSQHALHDNDFRGDGFEWIDHSDARNCTLSLIRKSVSSSRIVFAVFNFTPVPRYNYRVGVPRGGFWKELLNSDAEIYGGSGLGNGGGAMAEAIRWHNRPFALTLTLPPLAALFFASPNENGSP